MNKAQNLSGAVPALSIAATQLPPWAAAFCLAGSIFLITIQTLVPQNSRDRVHWWRDILRAIRNRNDG